MNPLSPDMGRIYQGLQKSSALEKQADTATPEELPKILGEKLATDLRTFELAKQAGILSGSIEMAKNVLSSPFGKGMATAAGAAIPATIAVNHMSTHAAEQARNKALQTGMGLAGIGATMYGIHNIMQPKMASESELDTVLLKLASIGYIDQTLEDAIEAGLTKEAAELAEEVRAMNREYGVEILKMLVG